MKERTDTFLNFKNIHDCAYIADYFGLQPLSFKFPF